MSIIKAMPFVIKENMTMNNIDQITNQDTQSTSGTYTLEEYMEVVVNGNQRYIPLYSRA